jgi:cytochrome P450
MGNREDACEIWYATSLNSLGNRNLLNTHTKGGPIVRINPREVHIKDPHYYEEIFASGTRKRDKDPAFVVTFTAPHSMISTTDHDHHRFRRSLLNPFFSKKSILQLSSVIEERVQKLMERFGESHENRSVLELDAAFAGLTADIIMQYCCGQSWGFLEDENFKNDFRNAVNEGVAYIHIFRFFPLLAPMLRLIPQRLLCQVQAGRASIYELQRWVYEQSIASVGPEQNQKKSTRTTCRTIFDALTDPAIPADERTLGRLQDEGLVILCAGTETTARALTLAAFHLTREPSMMLKLREELRQVMPTPNSPITWPQLESLPYLVGFAYFTYITLIFIINQTGIVNEALRLSHGLVTRLPRIAPTEALRYNDYLIPPGVTSQYISFSIRDTDTCRHLLAHRHILSISILSSSLIHTRLCLSDGC